MKKKTTIAADEDVRPRLPRDGFTYALTALLLATSTMLVAQAYPTPCAESSAHSGSAVAALRPANILLAISSPRAGEMVTETSSAESVTVSVDYWGPNLVANTAAHGVDDYHLVFFLDVPDGAYLGTLSPIPHCETSILHTSGTSVTFDHVVHGWHMVHVMLVGSNDVSVNPPVATSVTFVVSGGP